MKTLLSSWLLVLFGASAAFAADYDQLKAEAEALFTDGSYAQAREVYSRIETNKLPVAEQRWVAFRLADTLWRAQAGTQTADSTKYDQAQRQLEVLVRDVQRVEDRDRVWAEAQESLGDFWWMRRDNRNWGQAWPYYERALDWWAGAADIKLARQRYLQIIWNTARPKWVEPYYYGYHGNTLPLPILEHALKIAQTANDKAHAHYLIAMSFRYRGGDWDQRRRVPAEFEAALKAGKETDWYDDALFHYAQWMESTGIVTRDRHGNWRQEPDYVKALELYRRLVKEFTKGETRYYDDARNRIENITKPVVNVSVANIFLPGSEQQFNLHWRNIKNVEFAIYRVDLPADVQPASDENWIRSIALGAADKVKSWSKQTGDKGDYKPGNETIRLDDKLPAGAYVLEARGGGEKARDLLLVSDVSVVLKTSRRQALVYFCGANDGAPVAGGRVRLWERYYDGNKWRWRDTEKESDKDGLAVFELQEERRGYHRQLIALATLKDRQAFSLGQAYRHSRDDQPWKIYAFTDRPAYRPKEQVQWKFVARQYGDGVYSTPAGRTIEFEITDPHGAKVHSGTATLNDFGSASGALDLTEQMPLGEYRVRLSEDKPKRQIGDATLFRLEEYKLPEFKVSVQTPEEGGKKKKFRLGDTVEVVVQADYYFGGPVANATVEVLVYQRPFQHWWMPPREYPWFYDDLRPQWRRHSGDGQIIKRETLKTDATGKATLTFETPRNIGQDFEYKIEARVTDASRREIIGGDNVRVTRQRFYVYPRPAHNIYRPQDKVTVNIKALDANEQPVATEGTVKVTRDYWFEVWLAPDGREVKGDELKKLQREQPGMPPGWRVKFRGYEQNEIFTRSVKTDTNGEAEVTFTPEREGYYRFAWTTEEPDAPPITANATVWVAANATAELGYRHGGIEIIVDQDTFRVGQKAPVMLLANGNDQYVLFSVEGDDLQSYRLVHLTGTAKLVELDITEQHVPNIFLNAGMVADRQFFTDTKQVIVPPTKNYLTVEVKPDRPQYQPREEGTLTVTTRDDEGKPVAAEVALGLVDESVYYIQRDYAGDPRQFYFGTKRSQSVQTQSTFQQKSYAKLVKDGEDKVRDERWDRDQNEEWEGRNADPYAAFRDFEYRGRPATVAAGSEVSSHLVLGARSALAGPNALPEPDQKSGTPTDAEEPAVVVRSDFRATVLWQPELVTDANGTATVKVTYPDSLTGWKATARAASAGNQFGIADTTTRTKQPLIVRLQAPRFFVVGDVVTISAALNNNTDAPLTVQTALEGFGTTNVMVTANGEARADWTLPVKQAGELKLKVTGRAEKYADAMEKSFPVFEHGIEKFIATAGKVRGDDVTVRLEIPKERKTESTTLTVQVAPSLAVTMLDALPYLIDYPYGCVEQTMSRFLPAVITAKTLGDLGLQPDDVMGKAFGGIERAFVEKTQPKGPKPLEKLDAMVKAGLDRLYDFQHADGGWGWWKKGDSDHFMTAYVVWGLVLSRQADVAIKADALRRGADFLDKELVEEEENPDMQAWMLHALSAYHAVEKRRQVGKFQAKAFDSLWVNRDRLNAYTRVLLALAAHQYGYTDQAKMLIANLENGVKRDDRPDAAVLIGGKPATDAAVMGTAHWGEDGVVWRWSDGGVEATAFALRALLTIDPQHPLIEPVSNWLIKNRRGAQWKSTRDTAIVVLALNDYLRVTKELSADIEYEVLVNGTRVVTKKLSGADAVAAPSRLAVDRKLIKDGANNIRIRRKSGKGPLYFGAEAKFFSLEEPITPAGNEVFVRRQYYKLVGRPTLLKGDIYEKQPLNDGETVTSGDRVETVITIEAKNNYEYLVFEDLKPAGLEAVEIRSGADVYAKEIKAGGVADRLAHRADESDYTGRTRWVYQELRDRKVALFVDKLPEGVWEIRYDLRAEVPGQFHALPVLGHAMYVPEIRANGAEVRVTVADRLPE